MAELLFQLVSSRQKRKEREVPSLRIQVERFFLKFHPLFLLCYLLSSQVTLISFHLSHLLSSLHYFISKERERATNGESVKVIQFNSLILSFPLSLSFFSFFLPLSKINQLNLLVSQKNKMTK